MSLIRGLLPKVPIALGFVAVATGANPCWSQPSRERLAVLIVVPDDNDLSDSLTEVAISRIASSRKRESVGLSELSGRLSKLESVRTRGLADCLMQPECLKEVGTIAGVERAVVGIVSRHQEHFALDLALVHPQSGRVERHFVESGAADAMRLVGIVQRGVSELFAEPSQRPAPIASMLLAVTPRAVASSATVSFDGKANTTPAVRTHEPYLRYLAYGAAALGVLTFAAAAITGSEAAGTPQGVTRAQAQQDLTRRQGYARATNGLLIAGGTATAISVVSFTLSWK